MTAAILPCSKSVLIFSQPLSSRAPFGRYFLACSWTNLALTFVSSEFKVMPSSSKISKSLEPKKV
jgi:hypothetical protein